MKVLNATCPKEGYEIYIDDSINKFYTLLRQHEIETKNKIFLITDDIIYNIYIDLIYEMQCKIQCKVYYFVHGENNKNINTVQSIYDFLIENNANRNSTLIALGGGVVGDLVGFVASTYMRGIKFVNIPTTLLSQVDSCIGGKVGYDYNGIKNVIGNFYNPIFVYICIEFLTTLKERQFEDGLGEVVKYGMIKDINLFDFINKNYKYILEKKNDKLFYIVQECLNIKAQIVEKDFNDSDIRNILNFGHTIGHGIEVSSKFTISHGEAVALGMLVAVKLSEKKLSLTRGVYLQLETLLEKLGLPTRYKVDNYSTFLYAINHDKKNTDKIRFVLLEDISKCKIKLEVTAEEIYSAVEESISRG